jgi:hypothetical protein
MDWFMRAKAEYGYDTISQYFDASLSVLANARNLYAIDDTKSVKGWEMSIYRWKKGAHKKAQTKEPKIESELDSVNASYHFDVVNDIYYTYLSIADQMVSVAGDKHRSMKEAYSNMVGKPASMNEICRDFGIPRAWFDEYRRRHGWTHDMSPYTDEEIATTDVEQLVQDLVLRNKHSLHKKYERRKWKNIEESAERYDMFNTYVLNEFKQLVGEAKSNVPKLNMIEDESEYSLVISPTDFHWGKYGWVDEVGETYHFDEARKRLMEKTEELICRLPSRPEQIILATGSDWFHVDTDAGTTTKGTPQDMCGSPAEILMTGCKLAREHIDLLRQVAPVKVVFMPGNHDRMSAIALMMYLSAVYEETEDCEVVVSPSTRQYVHYGNNLLGFIHGDGAKNLEELMSCEQRELWGKCEHHAWFHGHLHHRKVLESKGCLIIQLPSLAGHDRYHARQGYTTSKAGLAAHLIDKQKGLIATYFAPVEGQH